MKKQITNLIILIQITVLILGSIGCEKSKYIKPARHISFRSNQTEFPKTEAPVGQDVVSSTTNHSSKARETDAKINALAGAVYIEPPQIRNYGAVSMSYPVEVPVGRGGIQPSINISYSSSSGDGITGIGWNLSTGLSSVSRITDNGQLYYDHRDTFSFNGKRLVKVRGAENSENGVYRFEIESGFFKLELTDAENGGVWRIYDKSGGITILGETKQERIYHSKDDKKTYIWNFSRAYDLNSNYMYAVYDNSDFEDNRVSYIKEIRYTGNYNENTPARQYIRFNYQDRDDSYISKTPGFIMKMDRLLDTIEVGWDDPKALIFEETKLWQYKMVYEISEDSSRPVLKTIESTRKTTTPKFKYQKAHHSLLWKLIGNKNYSDPQLDPEKTKYFEGDFNGDGISDMVFFNPQTGEWKAVEPKGDGKFIHKTYGNKFKGYDNPLKIQWFKGNLTGDFNGDGRADIAFYLPEKREFWIAEHNGIVFKFKNYGKMPFMDFDIFNSEWFPGDYDGNGLSDIVLFDEGTGQWTLMSNLGGKFKFKKFSRHFKNLFRNDYNPDKNMDSSYTSDNSKYGKDREKIHFLNGDYNGDGRTDISIYDSRDGKWWVAENYRHDEIGFRLDWKLYKTFTAPEQALFSNERFSGDYNGDGFTDFLLFDRKKGEWIIGETLDSTIKFRVFSKTPQFKEITRWLQGDFNGDGRTDIGFYSSTDNNFWIGEATPAGFRYRIYNNLAYGPDPEKVLKTSLPKDEVKIESGISIISNSNTTSIINYQFNNSYYTNRGEIVFTGYLSEESTSPEFLIFNKEHKRIYYKQAKDVIDLDVDTDPFVNVDLESKSIKLLGDWKKNRYFYEKGKNLHSVKSIEIEDSKPKIVEIAKFEQEGVKNFNIDQSLYLIDRFSDKKSQLLVLDDSLEDPAFKLFSESEEKLYEIQLDEAAIKDDFKAIFKNYRDFKNRIKFFSGVFKAGESVKILFVDMRKEKHRWYAGQLNEGKINFTELKNEKDIQFHSNGYDNLYRVVENSILYYNGNNTKTNFYKLTLDQEINEKAYNQLPEGVLFKNEFDHNNSPIVYDKNRAKIYNLETSKLMDLDPGKSKEDSIDEYNIKRPDLIDKIYPFRWIQGDYNGDNKTDIGIFHLKEKKWYFAMTHGTVPDMITEVDNGIGGTYEIEYINSTTVDNTGEDNIPDLPMNYKICSKLTTDDGRGNRYTTEYRYKNGYAFSDFIDGKRESDYFGFGEFEVIDAFGSKTISKYHNVPYDDFRKNRALAGAIKENRFFGWDNIEYSKSIKEYKLHEIVPQSNSNVKSYIVEPVKVKKFVNNRLMETVEAYTELIPGKYELKSKTEKVTDHYKDKVHSPATISSYTEYENIEQTNETRVKSKSGPFDTSYETTTEYDYDTNGRVIKEVMSYTGQGLEKPKDAVKQYEYDNYGNRTKEINSSEKPHKVQENIYDESLNQFVTESRIHKEQGYLSTQNTINYKQAFGAVEKREDPNGNSTYFEYDEYGRLFRQLADIGEEVVLLSENSYNVKLPISAKVTKYTGNGEDVAMTRIFTDGMGRNIHSITSATNEKGKKYLKSGMIVYNPVGQVIRVSQPHWADDDEIDKYKAHTKEKHPTINEHDASGRVKYTIVPKTESEDIKTKTMFTYNDPYEVIETHSVGRSKRTIKNGRGQVLYIEDSGTGDDGEKVTAKIGFAYDIAGNRIKKMDLNSTEMNLDIPQELFVPGNKDASGHNIFVWKYNGFGQVTATNDPDLGYSKQTYNGFGEIETATDTLNRTTSLKYDRMGRVIEKILPGDEGNVTYTYDTLSGSENSIGKVVAIENSSQRKEFSYDKLGRVKREVRKIDSVDGEFETRFKYDLLNRKTEIEYPLDQKTGSRIKALYSYNNMGVSSIKINNGTVDKSIISGITYNEFGQMAKIARGNGTVTNYDYDIKGRLKGLTTETNSSEAESKIQDIRYDFKVDNSIKSVINNPEIDTSGKNSSTTEYSYKYDGLNRLIHAKGSSIPLDQEKETKRFERGYKYAQNGNLTNKTIYNALNHSVSDSWDYSYKNHMVTGINTSKDGERFILDYDAAGNMISKVDYAQNLSKEMFYDSSNRIKKVMNPDNGSFVGEYWYDEQGFRVRKLAHSEIGGDQHLVEVIHPSMYFGFERRKSLDGELTKDTEYSVNNIYMNGVRVAAVIPNGSTQYYHTDQVDSVKVVTNDDGMPVTTMEYLPYGESWFQEGNSTNHPKYNSQEYDPETKFYYYNARYYDPEIGRFVTADSVIDGHNDTQGWNGFSYVKGNPIKFVDPDGMMVNVSDSVKAEFNVAINHLRENGLGYFVDETYGELNKRKDITVTINHESIYGIQAFLPRPLKLNPTKEELKRGASIYWNPRKGTYIDGKIASPATTLLHELTHAARYYNIQSPLNYGTVLKTGVDSSYDTVEEKWACTIANIASLALGEPFRPTYKKGYDGKSIIEVYVKRDDFGGSGFFSTSNVLDKSHYGANAPRIREYGEYGPEEHPVNRKIDAPTKSGINIDGWLK